jgi:hypothetical protein
MALSFHCPNFLNLLTEEGVELTEEEVVPLCLAERLEEELSVSEFAVAAIAAAATSFAPPFPPPGTSFDSSAN